MNGRTFVAVALAVAAVAATHRHPEAQALDIRPHDLETYDELAHPHDDPDPEP